jgi:hypothetical protein
MHSETNACTAKLKNACSSETNGITNETNAETTKKQAELDLPLGLRLLTLPITDNSIKSNKTETNNNTRHGQQNH